MSLLAVLVAVVTCTDGPQAMDDAIVVQLPHMLLCTKSVYWDEYKQNTCSYNFHHIHLIAGWPGCKPAWCRNYYCKIFQFCCISAVTKVFFCITFVVYGMYPNGY